MAELDLGGGGGGGDVNDGIAMDILVVSGSHLEFVTTFSVLYF